MRTAFRSLFPRRFAAALLAAGALAASPVLRPAEAHETDCPHCKRNVVQDTATQDNEVAIRYGRKRIEYRCVACALAEARTQFKKDLTILAPSELRKKPVVMTRTGGTWTAAPAGAVFIAHPAAGHKSCHLGFRAFTNRAAFDAHVKANNKLLAGAKPVTLAEIVEVKH